jgi:peptidoglycan/LPS O-acetylase OafA/YrhL
MWLPRRYLLPAVTAILLLAFFSRTAVIAYGTFPVLSYVSTPTRMDTLAAGSALAILMLSPAARDWWAAYAKHMALLGALLIVCIAGLRHGYEIVDPVVRVVGFGANIVFCLGLVAWAALGETALSVEWLRADALRWIGSRSYAGYLFHWPITLWVSSVLHQQGMAPLPGILLTLSLVSVLTMLAAQLSWRVIERPALSFKERWAP